MASVKCVVGKKSNTLKQFKKPFKSLSPSKLVEKNKRLAFWTINKSWARNFSALEKLGITKQDLMQDALLELFKVAKAGKPSENEFSTLAVTRVRNMLLNKLKALKTKKRTGQTISLDQPLNGKDFIYSTIEAKKPSKTSSLELRENFVKIITGLNFSKRDKEIAIAYFGLRDGSPKSYNAVGKRYGLTKERIRQIVSNILQKLKFNPKMQQFKGLL